MNLRALRQHCERLLHDIEVPEPFSIQTFADAVSRRRQRPLYLLAKTSHLGPCGLWLALPEVDYVFYESATSPVHRDHIIVHELAHLLADHEPTEHLDPSLLRGLLPDLDPAVVQRVLARSIYSAVQEQEAEMIATLVLQRAGQQTIADQSESHDPREAALLERLESTLGARRSARG